MKFLFPVGVFFFVTFQSFAQLPNVLPVLDSLTDDQIAGFCVALQQESQVLLNQCAAESDLSTQNRTRTEADLAAAAQDTLSDKAQIKALGKALKQARLEERKKTERRTSAEKLYSDAVLLVKSDTETQRKDLESLWKQWQKIKGTDTPPKDKKVKTPKMPRQKKQKPEEIEKPVSEILANAERSAENREDTTKNSGKLKRRKKSPKNAEADTPMAEPADSSQLSEKPAKRRKKSPKNAEADNPMAEPTDSSQLPEKPAKRKKNKKEAAPSADSSALAAEPAPKRTAPNPKKFKSYDPLNDVLINPPVPPCVLVQDTKDDFSGEIRRTTNRAELFRHTNSLIKNYIPGKMQVVCEASVNKTGPQVVLHLHLTVNDPGTRKAQGNLPKNSNAIFKFIDGSTYNLYNMQADDGKSDATGQTFSFEGLFALDRDAIRKMRANELDKIRLNWANGYEDYEIHDIRLLMRQLKCIGE